MSDVVEKTLSALPSLLSLDPQPGASKLSATSKLGQLVRSITELTSKNEEERLITKELAAIKEQISSPNTTMRQMRELMVRAMYCEMLGYEASFAHIHAIKLAQQGTVLEKRVGYLAVSLFLNESHELLLLLVNTVLKDLQSTNLIEVCMALTVVSQIFPKDMIPSILPLVEEKLSHQKEIIRRKAVLALYKFYLIAPNQVQHIHGKFRKALCDKDPGVMMCSLHIYLRMIKENPDSYKELTSSFVTILRQVVGGKLPQDFNYHGVPAPWLQIQLLRILSLLGKEDQSMSELMYEVLDESLRRAEMNHNITYAILYECVKAIYTVYPKAELLEKAARCIGNFVMSPKINLKYLELLFRITNAQNVTVIVEKMLGFLRLCDDNYTTVDLVLGEYSCMREGLDPHEVMALLRKLLNQRGVSSETRSWVLCALTKLCQSSGAPELVVELADSLSSSLDTVLRQQAHELQCLTRDAQLHARVLRQARDSTPVDSSLSFLDGFVSEALAAGAAPYKPPYQRQEELCQERALSLEPYGLSLPVSMSSCTLTDRQSPTLLSVSSGMSGNSTEPSLRTGAGTLMLDGVKRVWGKEGYLPQKQSASEPSAVEDEPNSSLQTSNQEVTRDASQPEPDPELKPEPPHMDQEKQQLASSLFVGLGSQNSSMSLLEKPETPAPRFRRKHRQHETASLSSSTSETSTNSSQSSRLRTDTLYDGLLEEQPAAHLQNSNHTPTSTTVNGSCGPTQSSRSANGLFESEADTDTVDSLMIRPDTRAEEASVVPQNGCSDIGVLQLPPELEDLPHSDIVSLTSDPDMSISCCRVYREDALLLVLFVCNTTETPLRDVTVELSFEELEMTSLRGNVMECLEGGDCSVCRYTLLMEKPHIQATFRGSVLYQTQSGHSHTLLFSGKLSTADFIRPLKLSTEEYGKLWLSFSNDVKQNLKLLTGTRGAKGPLETTLNALQESLQLHTVHII
ncbi:AP-4 complex subunit epsilon-1, partial [Clarias magur]